MKQKNYQRWSRPLLLTLLSVFMAFSGASSAWADTLTENFNSVTVAGAPVSSYVYSELSNGWKFIGDGTVSEYEGWGVYTLNSSYRVTGNSLWSNHASASTSYIVIPVVMTGTVQFYVRQINKNAAYAKVYEAIQSGDTYVATGEPLASKIYPKISSGSASSTYDLVEVPLGSANKMLAIQLVNTSMDDFTATKGTAGPVAVTGVSLNKTSTSLVVGQNETLTATIAPANATNKNVSWSVTAGDTYASVSDEGVVTAVAPGEATVTVTTEDGGFTASCNVTVTAVVNVTSVSLNKTETSLFVGENETLTATVSPDGATNKNISWESSDPTVVSVVDGELTALKAGTATITVTTEDGAKTATCAVTVSNVVVTGVTLDVTSANLIAGGTVTLTPTVAPNNATNKNVSWESDAEGVATVDNGVVTAVAPGTAHITVTTEDGGHTASCTITVLPSLTVYDNTATSSKVPVYGNWADAYLKSEFVVPASELTSMDGGTISAMTFYLSTSASAAWTGTFNVFIKEVDNTTLAAYSGTEGATSVYTGTLDATGSTMTINFGSTYKYNGGNLLVGIYQTVKGNYKDVAFYGKEVSGASLWGYNSSSLGSVSLNQGDFIPKTTFVYTPGTPKAKMVVTPTALDFGTISSSSTAEDKQKTFTISNAKTNADLTGLTVSCESEGYAVSALPRTTITGTGEDHADIELTVTFSGTTEKVYNGTVTVSATDMTPIEVSLTATYADADATIEVTEAGSVESVDGTTVAFGEKGKQVTKTFTIANGGDKTLHVTSIASNNTTDFTVSPASVDVAGHSSANFTVTFVYGSGAELDTEETATITVTSDAGNKSFTVTGTRIDMWSEDFSGGLPSGWDAESYWTFSDGVAHGAYNYSNNRTKALTTPLLTVTGTTDVLTYKAKSTSTFVSIKIKYSKDGGDFEDLKTQALEDNMASFETYEITGLSAGNYKFQFMNDDYDLDDFEGFKLTPIPAHEAVVKDKTIPTTGNQYVEYTASVDVKVTGTNDEQLTVKFFIGDTQYGESVVKDVASGNTESFEVTFTPNAAVSGDAYFTIESDDIVAFQSDKVAVNIAAATVWSENATVNPFVEGTYASAVLEYTPTAGWGTIALPFGVDDLSIFGTNVSAYEFDSYNGNLNFNKVTSLTNFTPYLIYVGTPTNEPIKLFNVTISGLGADDDYCVSSNNGVTFQGTYIKITDGSLDGKFGVSKDNRIAKGNGSTTMKALRAYFAGSIATGARISIFDETTGISRIYDANEVFGKDAKVYNLSGQKVENAKKGVYIVNGRKVVVK